MTGSFFPPCWEFVFPFFQTDCSFFFFAGCFGVVQLPLFFRRFRGSAFRPSPSSFSFAWLFPPATAPFFPFFQPRCEKRLSEWVFLLPRVALLLVSSPGQSFFPAVREFDFRRLSSLGAGDRPLSLPPPPPRLLSLESPAEVSFFFVPFFFVMRSMLTSLFSLSSLSLLGFSPLPLLSRSTREGLFFFHLVKRVSLCWDDPFSRSLFFSPHLDHQLPFFVSANVADFFLVLCRLFFLGRAAISFSFGPLFSPRGQPFLLSRSESFSASLGHRNLPLSFFPFYPAFIRAPLFRSLDRAVSLPAFFFL